MSTFYQLRIANRLSLPTTHYLLIVSLLMFKALQSKSFVILLLFTFKLATAQSPAHLINIGLQDSIYSEVLEEQRQIWIHLPNGGDLREDHQYPVIYLLDGAVHLGGLAMVQEYYNYFRLPEMIVVGISNQTNRTRDLTPSIVTERHGWPIEASGGADTFTRFLAEELIPYIDRTYPTSSHRVLIGHSYGGLFTINTLLHHQDLFTNYIAIDPSLDWDNQKLLHEVTDLFERENFSGKGLFISIANELIRFSDNLTIDNVMQDTTSFTLGTRSSLTFANIIESNASKELRFAWAFYKKDIHGSIPLISIRDGLIFLYDWWELKNPSKYNDPSTSEEELVSMIRERSHSLTANMGYPLYMEEELLDMLANMLLDMEQQKKAQAVLELYVEYYPDRAGAHTSMARLFENQNNIEQALLHANQALAIRGSKADKSLVDRLMKKR